MAVATNNFTSGIYASGVLSPQPASKAIFADYTIAVDFVKVCQGTAGNRSRVADTGRANVQGKLDATLGSNLISFYYGVLTQVGLLLISVTTFFTGGSVSSISLAPGIPLAVEESASAITGGDRETKSSMWAVLSIGESYLLGCIGLDAVAAIPTVH